MASPANTFTSHLAVGNREDLSNVIHILDVADTPFLSALERVPATSTKHS